MERSLAQPHTERAGAPEPASTGTKPWGAPRTHHRQGGGGGSRETGATTHSMGAGGQGTAGKAEQHARAPVRAVHVTYSVSRSSCRPWPAA